MQILPSIARPEVLLCWQHRVQLKHIRVYPPDFALFTDTNIIMTSADGTTCTVYPAMMLLVSADDFLKRIHFWGPFTNMDT